MKRYNFKHGIPEMEESEFGHWISYEDFNRATVLSANRSADRTWEASAAAESKIREAYENIISDQQNTIVVQSVVICGFIALTIFIVLGLA